MNSLNRTRIREMPAGSDLFEQAPHLKTIWSPEKTALAAEYAKADAGTGEVFAITYDKAVVGTTGFFIEPGDPIDTVRLRWTGVIEQYRRRGITRDALTLLVPKLRAKYPQCIKILEAVPINDNGKNFIIPFFTSMGFVPQGEPYKEDWADHMWQDYVWNKE
ncbi:hypothetical protein [Burkholderia phage BCSR5]|nr:hypothetical protein [Burkholderia phage BCSR5]